MKLKFLLAVLLIFKSQVSSNNGSDSQITKEIDFSKYKKDYFRKGYFLRYNSRLLESTKLHSFKIEFHFLNFSKTKLKKLRPLFTFVKKLFKKMLKISEKTNIQKFNSTKCDKFFKVPLKFKLKNRKCDLLIFVKDNSDFKNESRAFGTACNLAEITLRPNIGLMVLNQAFFINWHDASFQTKIQTLTHETIHILGFSKSLFPFFRNQPKIVQTNLEKTEVGEKEVQFIWTPHVIQFLKKHFNCLEELGARLENEGSPSTKGCHWEKTVFGNELMTASQTGGLILSGLTLALLEDTGWYFINYKMAEELKWGKNQGCRFLRSGCKIMPDGQTEQPLEHDDKQRRMKSEFCQEDGKYGCTFDYLSKSVCSYTGLSDGCMFYEHVEGRMCNQNKKSFWKSSGFEVLGKNSRCFEINESGRNKSACLRVKCINKKKIRVFLGNKFGDCELDTLSLEINGVIIFCPMVVDFCEVLEKSRQVCRNLGIKFGKICVCRNGWKGTRCQYRNLKMNLKSDHDL